jgi:hypothetical protein
MAGHPPGSGAEIAPEVIQNIFINERGELINPRVELLVHPERGQDWREWASRHLPVDLFRETGMIDTAGSDDWLNAVEHNVFVGAGADTLGQQLTERGAVVRRPSLVRAATVHDSTKRLDNERQISREAEAEDPMLATVMARFGYSPEEIEIAKNTGRQPDRYIEDPFERMQAIQGHSLEANVTGYVDARTRGSRIVSLDEARRQSVAAKPGSREFFEKHWYPYYRAVEDHLMVEAPGWDPIDLTDDAIYAHVRQSIMT